MSNKQISEYVITRKEENFKVIIEEKNQPSNEAIYYYRKELWRRFEESV